ncbi:MAG: Rieske 2Fe-2S domain-containing protein [Myxococcales bacterium]|nr:Rieske 2Fe-2S domain-containing protein [Myxococcales bacterium]
MTDPVSRFRSLCSLSSLGEGRPTLVRAEGGRRLVCIRRGDSVDVLDDECPHEGHPLSMGVYRDGVLTCQWHNWRFRAEDGECLVGHESVRRHPCEVLHGEVFVAVDGDNAREATEHERARHREDLRRAIDRCSLDGAVRAALRLSRLDRPWAVWLVALDRVARRAHMGPGDALSRLRAAWALYEANVLSLPEACAVACAGAIDFVAGARAMREPVAVESDEDASADVLVALAEERVEDAVAMALGLRPERSFEFVCRAWLSPWLSTRLWDGGLLLARVEDALAIFRRIDADVLALRADGALESALEREELGRYVLAAVLRGAASAVADSELPGWRSTRQALLDARSMRATDEARAIAADALAVEFMGSEAQALAATRSAVELGASPATLAAIERALGVASVERLARYDLRWSRRRTVSPVRCIDVGAAARSARALAVFGPTVSTAQRLALSIATTGLVGKLRRTSLDARPPPDTTHSLATLAALVRRGCLADASLRAESAPLAFALWSLHVEHGVAVEACAAAAQRAFVEDAPLDLGRIAEVSELRTSRDGHGARRPGALE